MTSSAVADSVPSPSTRPAPDRRSTPSTIWTDRLAAVGLALLGAALGASQLVHGLYSETAWAPVGLGALGLVVAITVAAPRSPPLTLLVPMLGLWLWSLISAAWSESTDAAHVAANRWLLYGAVIVVLAWALAGDRRRAVVLLTSAAAGVVVVALWMLSQMLLGDGPSLFLATRLNDPLGYVNGQAAYLLVAAWPCLALAEHRGFRASGAIAGIGMAALVVLLGVGLLCQSRSWEVALFAGIVVLEAVVPGRRRRAAALLLAGATMAAIYTPLAGVWRHPSPITGLATSATTRHAAAAIIIGAVAAGLIWAIVVLSIHHFARAGSPARARVRRIGSALLVALGLTAAVAIGARAGAIEHRIHSQYEAFVQLSPGSGTSRLVSGAGNRYDYWRVALIEFRSAPVGGVGAGNYDPGYYRHRRTTEAVTQPHSLELQTLAELGIVGFLLLVAFLAAVVVGLGHTARVARHDLLARGVAVAAGGAFTVWLVQTSADWIDLIPGVTAIALSAAVALASGPESRSLVVAGRARVAAVAVAGVIAIVGTVTIAPRIVSLSAQASAQQALARGAPRTAVVEATKALEYDPGSVDALVLRAAGFAALHSFEASYSDLKRAVAVEPRNWATWALVGDLLTRHGDRSGARAAYAHALALDPLEPELRSALSTPAPPPGR
jgi:hypothetical protein